MNGCCCAVMVLNSFWLMSAERLAAAACVSAALLAPDEAISAPPTPATTTAPATQPDMAELLESGCRNSRASTLGNRSAILHAAGSHAPPRHKCCLPPKAVSH